MNRNNPFGNYRASIFAGLILMLMVSCSITKNAAVDTKDLSYLYNPTKSSFRPGFSVFNESPSRSVLTVRFPASSLFFSEANPKGIPTAQLLVTVKLFNISAGRLLTDTAFVDLNIIREEGRQDYLYKLPLKVERIRLQRRSEDTRPVEGRGSAGLRALQHHVPWQQV